MHSPLEDRGIAIPFNPHPFAFRIMLTTGVSPAIATKALESDLFKNFVRNMDERFKIESVSIEAVDLTREGDRVLFIKLRALVKDEAGNLVFPGSVFLRGGAVAILFILVCEAVEYAVLTVQARFPTGIYEMIEIPAGMLDGSGDFVGVAAKEIGEELGVTITKDDLIPITPVWPNREDWAGVYPSCGGCDEFIRYFAVRQECSREELASFQGRLTGVREEGELIALKLVKLDELAEHTPDGKALTALALYERSKKRRDALEAKLEAMRQAANT